MAANHTPIRVVIVTMDTHLVSATERARFALQKKMPGLALTIHAASSWTVDAKALKACIDDIARADIVVSMMLFMEDHFLARDRRAQERGVWSAMRWCARCLQEKS